jgi:hypothetical protein
VEKWLREWAEKVKVAQAEVVEHLNRILVKPNGPDEEREKSALWKEVRDWTVKKLWALEEGRDWLWTEVVIGFARVRFSVLCLFVSVGASAVPRRASACG